MARPRLGYWDYVKAAFRRRLPVPLLGAMPVNQMAIGVFAVLGLANPGFWFLGAAAELGYLAWLSSNRRFQALVQGEQIQAAQLSREERLEQVLRQLSAQARGRYEQLLSKCRHLSGGEVAGGDELGGIRTSNLNQLLSIFLRLLSSREAIHANLERVDLKSLAREVKSLEERIAALGQDTDGALARSLAGTAEIQKKRLQNLEHGRSSLQVIDAELGRIEQQVELMREEAVMGAQPEVLSRRLDSVTSLMQETTSWMNENSDLLGSLTGDDDSLGALPAPAQRQAE